MTSLPGGHSDAAESQRQVVVVEENPERRDRLCAWLSRHGLQAKPVLPLEIDSLSPHSNGAILLGNGHASSVTWERLAERIRAVDKRVPILLLGPLADDTNEEQVIDAVERWYRATPAVPQARHAEHILLVDDDPKFRQILQAFLELKGFQVRAAGSGEDALQQLAREEPRVVLLDMKMPGMDGLLTLKHLRLAHQNLPVIFATQMDEEDLIGEAKILGVNDYLVKPFSFEFLEAILRTKIFV